MKRIVALISFLFITANAFAGIGVWLDDSNRIETEVYRYMINNGYITNQHWFPEDRTC